MIKKIFPLLLLLVLTGCHCYDDENTNVPARLTVGIQVRDLDTKQVIKNANITMGALLLEEPTNGEFRIAGNDVNKVIHFTSDEGKLASQDVQVITECEGYAKDTVLVHLPEVISARKALGVSILLQKGSKKKIVVTMPQLNSVLLDSYVKTQEVVIKDYKAGTHNYIPFPILTGQVTDVNKLNAAIDAMLTPNSLSFSMNDYKASQTHAAAPRMAAAAEVSQEDLELLKATLKDFFKDMTAFQVGEILNRYFIANGTTDVTAISKSNIEVYRATVEMYFTANGMEQALAVKITDIIISQISENLLKLQTNLGNPDHNGGNIGK